jgi:hypothetical protein
MFTSRRGSSAGFMMKLESPHAAQKRNWKIDILILMAIATGEKEDN